jgi:hypothetical protein
MASFFQFQSERAQADWSSNVRSDMSGLDLSEGRTAANSAGRTLAGVVGELGSPTDNRSSRCSWL